MCQRRREDASAGRNKNASRWLRQTAAGSRNFQLSGSIKRACFPVPTWGTMAAARSVGDGRSGATRSNASMASTGPSPQRAPWQADQLSKAPCLHRTAKGPHRAQGVNPGLVGVRHVDHCDEMRRTRRTQRPRRTMVEFGCQFSQHANVVACLELVRGDRSPALHLVQRIFEFRNTVAGIEVH